MLAEVHLGNIANTINASGKKAAPVKKAAAKPPAKKAAAAPKR